MYACHALHDLRFQDKPIVERFENGGKAFSAAANSPTGDWVVHLGVMERPDSITFNADEAVLSYKGF